MLSKLMQLKRIAGGDLEAKPPAMNFAIFFEKIATLTLFGSNFARLPLIELNC